MQQHDRLLVGDVSDDAAGYLGVPLVLFGEQGVGRLAAVPAHHLPAPVAELAHERQVGEPLLLYAPCQLGYARVLASKLALSTGCDVLSFEYRLAPEAPYPSAIDDALRVWDYLMYMGIGARDVIVAGDSAGGNLALELALAVKAQGRSQPCALVLMSPWTDMTMQGASYQKCAALDPMLTHDYIDSCRTAYRGANSTLEWEDPSLSPLFADLRGLPPTLIQVGTNEILKSDSINLAKAMTEQEVYAVLEVYPECWHVFQQMPIPHAAQAMESVGRFVQKIL